MRRIHTCTQRGHFLAKAASASLRGSRQLVVPSSLRKMAEGGRKKNGYRVHVPAVSPRELTGDHRAAGAGYRRGARGGVQILGMVLSTSTGWHTPSLWRLSRSERVCPPNPYIPMFDTAPVLEYPPFVMEQVPPAKVEEYVSLASAESIVKHMPIPMTMSVTPARTVGCAAPVTSRKAATTVFPTAACQTTVNIVDVLSGLLDKAQTEL